MNLNLGFVGTPKSARMRDATFIGSTNNFSKKGTLVLPRPLPTHQSGTNNDSKAERQEKPVLDVSLFSRRCEYLERISKQQNTILNEHSNDLKILMTQTEDLSTGWFRGIVVKDTEMYEGDFVEEALKTDAMIVGKGKSVSLRYPMRKMKKQNESIILMQMRDIHPRTALFSSAWIVLHKETDEGIDVRVSNFTIF